MWPQRQTPAERAHKQLQRPLHSAARRSVKAQQAGAGSASSQAAAAPPAERSTLRGAAWQRSRQGPAGRAHKQLQRPLHSAAPSAAQRGSAASRQAGHVLLPPATPACPSLIVQVAAHQAEGLGVHAAHNKPHPGLLLQQTLSTRNAATPSQPSSAGAGGGAAPPP